MRHYIFGLALLLTTLLGLPADALELLKIERRIPTEGTAPLLTLYPGIGLNLSFLSVDETVYKIWVTDPSWVAVDVEGSLNGDNPQGAKIPNLKRPQPLTYEHNLTGARTTLFGVTERALNRFRLEKGIGSARYDTVAITPDTEVIAEIPVPAPQSYQLPPAPEPPAVTPEPENTAAYEQLKQEAEQARQRAETEAKQRQDLEARLAKAIERENRQAARAAKRRAREQARAARRAAKRKARAARKREAAARRQAKEAKRAASQRERTKPRAAQTEQPPPQPPTTTKIPVPPPVTALQTSQLPSDPVILALEIQQGLPHAIHRGEIERSMRRGSYYRRVQQAIRYLRRGHSVSSAAHHANVTEKFLLDVARYGVQN